MLESGIQFEFSLPEFAHPNLARPPAQMSLALSPNSRPISISLARPPKSARPTSPAVSLGRRRLGGREWARDWASLGGREFGRAGGREPTRPNPPPVFKGTLEIHGLCFPIRKVYLISEALSRGRLVGHLPCNQLNRDLFRLLFSLVVFRSFASILAGIAKGRY